jgi:urease accessory protein
MSDWLPLMLQTTDSLFPTGAYAHSFGLEGAVHEGWVSTPDTLEDYLFQHLIPIMTYQELPTVVHAFEAAMDQDIEKLLTLDQVYGALRMSREIRTASAKIGSQRLSILSDILPNPFWNKLESLKSNQKFAGHEVLIIGIQGALSGGSIEASMMAAYYLGVSSQINAAFKLIRIGQKRCQSILSKCLSEAVEISSIASTIALDDIGWFTPALDICNARHETAYTRIFIS